MKTRIRPVHPAMDKLKKPEKKAKDLPPVRGKEWSPFGAKDIPREAEKERRKARITLARVSILEKKDD